MDVVQQVTCSSCGTTLARDVQGPCPTCGATARTFAAGGPGISGSIRATSSLSLKSRHEFYEKNRAATAAVVFITVVAPLLGLVLAGWPGVAVGLALGALSYLIAPHAAVKVREITRVKAK